jgi:hypothetical protein
MPKVWIDKSDVSLSFPQVIGNDVKQFLVYTLSICDDDESKITVSDKYHKHYLKTLKAWEKIQRELSILNTMNELF